MIRFTVNGQHYEFDIDSRMPLLWVLRDNIKLRGTKYACGIGLCGACTVHVDGHAAQSCVTPISSVNGKAITTIEGLSANNNGPVQRAWRKIDVPQCGYCQPGMMMAAAALLRSNPSPSDDDIDATITNVCRCGTYSRVRQAIHIAAKMLGEKSDV